MKYKKIIIIIGVIITASSCLVLQRSIVDRYGKTMNEESMTYVPVNDRIKPFLLGYETAIANYLWIRTVIYFGHHFLGDHQYVWLEKMLDIISKLNPHFYPVYEFAGLMLPELTGNIDAARCILERGIYNLGDRKYNLAFYMGMIYYRYYHDPILAAHYFILASHATNAPVEKLTRLAAAFLSKKPGDDRSMDMLALLYQASENPEVKRYLEECMKKLYAQEIGDGNVTEHN